MKHLLKIMTVFLPLFLGAVNPLFHVPLDGSAEVFGPDGKTIATGVVQGRSEYQPGVVGQALDVQRRAPDQVTTVVFNKMPAINCNSGTVAFWFKPYWNETDAAEHTIFNARDSQWKGFRFYLIKINDYVELSICPPEQIQIIRRNILKAGEWTHIAFSWDQASGTIRLFINGKVIGESSKPTAFKTFEPMEIVYFLGQDNPDLSTVAVGDGLYDEIKIFDKPLPENEITVLANSKDKK